MAETRERTIRSVESLPLRHGTRIAKSLLQLPTTPDGAIGYVEHFVEQMNKGLAFYFEEIDGVKFIAEKVNLRELLNDHLDYMQVLHAFQEGKQYLTIGGKKVLVRSKDAKYANVVAPEGTQKVQILFAPIGSNQVTEVLCLDDDNIVFPSEVATQHSFDGRRASTPGSASSANASTPGSGSSAKSPFDDRRSGGRPPSSAQRTDPPPSAKRKRDNDDDREDRQKKSTDVKHLVRVLFSRTRRPATCKDFDDVCADAFGLPMTPDRYKQCKRQLTLALHPDKLGSMPMDEKQLHEESFKKMRDCPQFT